MYEFFVLNMLLRGPSHGYLIAKVMTTMAGPHGRVSFGRLYPLLAKMEREGVIRELEHEREPSSGRQLRRFEITSLGKERFREMMLDTSSHLDDYQRLFSHKVSAFWTLTPDERVFLIDDYAVYCTSAASVARQELLDLGKRRGGFAALGGDGPTYQQMFGDLQKLLGRVIVRWESERQWAQALREDVFGEAPTSADPAPPRRSTRALPAPPRMATRGASRKRRRAPG